MAAGYPEDQILLTDYEDRNPFGPRPNDLGMIVLLFQVQEQQYVCKVISLSDILLGCLMSF